MIWLSILSFGKKVLAWAIDHPGIIIAVLVLAGTNWYTYSHTKANVKAELEAIYQPQIKKLNSEVLEYNERITKQTAKIDTLEKQSLKDAEALIKSEDLRKTSIAAVVSQYETKVKALNLKVYKLTIPATEVGAAPKTYDIKIEGGEVVCERFPSSYVETINQIIDQANSPTAFSGDAK